MSHAKTLAGALNRVRAFEASGQYGFLIQQYIPTGRRALRVVSIGEHIASYWRVQPVVDRFGTSLAGGAHIDHESDPGLQQAAQNVVLDFCRRSGLQLAGFDFIFDDRQIDADEPQPLALEINYFFGRKGLGGSSAYYRILEREVQTWLAGLSLRR